MLDLDSFRDQLGRSVADRLDSPRIDALPGMGGMFLGVVIAPEFEDMNEGQRQSLVWRGVLDHFAEEDLERIEFIYTDAPSEVDEPAPAPAPAG